MKSNPFMIRFQVGRTYRLYSPPTSDASVSFINGWMRVKAELSGRTHWGTRTILAELCPSTKETLPPSQRFVRCFVEEGVGEVKEANGLRKCPVEIASIQGIRSKMAKAYAHNEVQDGEVK